MPILGSPIYQGCAGGLKLFLFNQYEERILQNVGEVASPSQVSAVFRNRCTRHPPPLIGNTVWISTWWSDVLTKIRNKLGLSPEDLEKY